MENKVLEPYIKATITDYSGSGLTIEAEYNCNSKKRSCCYGCFSSG